MTRYRHVYESGYQAALADATRALNEYLLSGGTVHANPFESDWLAFRHEGISASGSLAWILGNSTHKERAEATRARAQRFIALFNEAMEKLNATE